ncbi:MAG: SWIM zinc finger family protein [Acidobacteria bacterium]|nr:SWIM zinc finger family protein [Acidobacteriota bacterium]
MEFNYRYMGNTLVESTAETTAMSFAPDTLRPPVFFSGELARGVPFREAISALNSTVISDLRFKPKDKEAYKAWAAERDLGDLARLLKVKEGTAQRLREVQTELTALRASRDNRMRPFLEARRKYFEYLYLANRDAWIVLDPVITVHPDEVFFECFSRDESAYGRLSCSYEIFHQLGDRACGTTNIDYSSDLYNEFQKIRSYKTTRLEVDPAGFGVQTGAGDEYREVKIDLPDSWVRGFLQVSAAMSLPMKRFQLHPMDLYNFCQLLRRHKERTGPRSIRFRLTPGHPVVAVFEPWNFELKCPRSSYEETEPAEIRVWGRRRLLILERLIPLARNFTVYLAGTGLPSFYVADLGEMSFTLGLSGWTANDWSRAGFFDLLAPADDVDDYSRRQVFGELQQSWFAEPTAMARQLGVDRRMIMASLFTFTQAGRAMYDLAKGVFRVRELHRTPLPLEQFRFSSPREEEAHRLNANRCVSVEHSSTDREGNFHLDGTVKERSKTYKPRLMLDRDEALKNADCTCGFFVQNKLFKGPCAHMLALRIAFGQKVKRFKTW